MVDEWSGRSVSGVGETEFAEPARVRISEIRTSAIEHYIACELDLGRHAAVMATIEDFAEQQPMRDRAWELLMLGRYRNGRQVEALDAYTTLRRNLVEGLGLEPSPDVEALRLAILDHDVAAPTGSSSTIVSLGGAAAESTGVIAHDVLPLPGHLDGHGTAPFAGRLRELAPIQNALAAGSATRASMFFVAGEAGMGKSRCAAELAASAHNNGSNVLYGRCTAGVLSDFQPWRAALGHGLAHATNEQLRQHRARFGDALFALAEVATAADSGGGTSVDPDSVVRAATSLLEDLAASMPLLVVLDDLQLADLATLRLMRYVVDNAAAPIVIVGLYRGDEVEPGHRLAEHIATAPSDAMSTVIELTGLDEEATRTLVASVTGLEVEAFDAEAIESLRRTTDGNPYFLLETVRSLRDSDDLAALTSGGRQVAVPSTVSRLLLQRVDRLSERVAGTLRFASAFGREFDLDVLAEALGRDEFDVLDDIEAALSASLVDDAPEGRDRFAFAHDLVHQSLAGHQSKSRRCRAHGAIADAMEKRYASRLDAHVDEIASQLLAAQDAGDIERTFSYCRRAGGVAIKRFATEEAIEWFERSLELLESVGTVDDALRADVLVQLGTAQRYAASGGQRETLIEAGRLALASRNSDALVESVIQNWRAVNGAGWTLDVERLDMCRAALRAVGSHDSPQRARVLAALGLAMWEVEFTSEVRGVYEELISLARRLDDPHILVTALDVSLTARNYRPSASDLAAFAAELRSLHPTVNLDPGPFISVASSLATTGIQLADRDLLEHAMNAIDAEANRSGLPAAVNASRRGRAVRAWIAGDAIEFEHSIAAVFEHSSQYEGSDTAMLVFRAQMFFAMWMRGREGEAVDADVFVPDRASTRPLYRAIQALAHLGVGQPAGATRLLDAELDAGFWPNDNHWTTQAHVMWADAAVQLGRRDVCGVLVDELTISSGSIAGQFMSPLEPVDTALGRMCVVLGRLDDAEMFFDGASATVENWDAQWMRARVELGRCELEGARGTSSVAVAQQRFDLRGLAVRLGYGSIVRRLDVLEGPTSV